MQHGDIWTTTFYRPDGGSQDGTTPPCEVGPCTERYLAAKAQQIAEAAVSDRSIPAN